VLSSVVARVSLQSQLCVSLDRGGGCRLRGGRGGVAAESQQRNAQGWPVVCGRRGTGHVRTGSGAMRTAEGLVPHRGEETPGEETSAQHLLQGCLRDLPASPRAPTKHKQSQEAEPGSGYQKTGCRNRLRGGVWPPDVPEPCLLRRGFGWRGWSEEASICTGLRGKKKLDGSLARIRIICCKESRRRAGREGRGEATPTRRVELQHGRSRVAASRDQPLVLSRRMNDI